MRLVEYVNRFFSMSDEVWLLHANPVSVYSRFVFFIVFIAVCYSREYVGGYFLILLLPTILLLWLNPRMFNRPRTTSAWASRAIMGERIWLDRHNHSIPDHQDKAIRILLFFNVVAALVLLTGLVTLDLWVVVWGLFMWLVFKVWFLDRMAWLFNEMFEQSERYRSWLY